MTEWESHSECRPSQREVMVGALVGWGQIIPLGNFGLGLVYYYTVNWAHRYPPPRAVVKTNHDTPSTTQMPH